MSLEDEIRNISGSDQAKKAADEFARIAGDYFGSLLRRGFMREEALALTRDFQTALIQIQSKQA